MMWLFAKNIFCSLSVLLLLFSAGCQKVSDSPNNSIFQGEISKKQAIDLVEVALSSEELDIRLEFDREVLICEKNYYRIHAYTLSEQVLIDEEGNLPYQQMFTYEWFYVDKITGELYVENFYLPDGREIITWEERKGVQRTG